MYMYFFERTRFQQTAGICEVPRGLWFVNGMGVCVGLRCQGRWKVEIGVDFEEAHAVCFGLAVKLISVVCSNAFYYSAGCKVVRKGRIQFSCGFSTVTTSMFA